MVPSLLRFANWVRARFTTPPGRHRAGGGRPAPPLPAPLVTVRRPAATVRHWYEPLDGGASALVRPYLRACEREEACPCAGVAG
ncbi:hypothetical protein [Streptomyces sp. CB03238]|uniref:hypothetical protein n=1 Tax=Streptomyces sp. CB03238 TaxID=1907777 RepID=UPI0015C445D0|nr:hypothetical protein [Streptomyces sp. CB03238]